MKKLLIICLIGCLYGTTQAQIGDKIKNKATEKVNRKVDDALNGNKKEIGEEQSEEPNEQSQNESSEEENEKAEEPKNETTTAVADPAKDFKSYSRFDFVPGDQVVYFEDFSQDVVGEFPIKWTTNGGGETVTTNQFPGKWLKIREGSNVMPEFAGTMPENFTLEYDVLLKAGEDGGVGDLVLYMGNAGADQASLISEGYDQSVRFSSLFRSDLAMTTLEDSRTGVHGSFNVNLSETKLRKVHVSVSVNKQRMRIWYDNEKIYDMPTLLPKGNSLNSFYFSLSGLTGNEDAYLLLSNMRLAQGMPDMRSKLITEGKLVTRGITFDSGSDKIKPESYGTMKEIAKVLAENPAINVKIVGHTDSDGSDVANLELSKKRAVAIKDALAKDFGVAATRLQTDGKGETAPVAPNTTPEGKANNRRVEFLKITN